MSPRTNLILLALATAATTFSASAQVPIADVPFEFVADETSLEEKTTITLAGDVNVTGDLDVAGLVQTGAGIVFPDGTVQTTAAVEGASANMGLYDNRIVLMTPPLVYSEICFKNGLVYGDIHSISESTAGGNCVPGDRGYLIERNQRSAANWEDARLLCLLDGLRLPEAFEWLISCNNAANFGLNNMTGDWEWVSNTASPITSVNGIGVNAAGLSGCNTGSWGFAGNSSNVATNFAYHCMR